MKLRRSGSQRFHGWTDLFDKGDPRVEWDNGSKSVKLKVYLVDDPYSETSSYDYEVFLSPDDIQNILEALADEGINDSQSQIAQTFSIHLDKLLKIMMCSIGIVAMDKKEKAKEA